MRRLLVGMFFLMACSAGAAEDAAPRRAAHVPWLEDVPWSDVIGLAGEPEDRPILVDFYAQWCGPCKLLDAYVYNEPEVIRELADVVTFKVDIDKPEYRQLKERFHIILLPTLVWCDQEGREIDRFTGSVSAPKFLEIIRSFREGGNTFNRIVDLVAAYPEDPGLLFDLARRQAERGNEERARILYHRLMNLRFKADPQVVVDGMLGLAAMEHDAGSEERARDIARRAAAAQNRLDPGVSERLMAIAAFQGVLADTTGILETYRLLIECDDTDTAALDGFARVATESGRELKQATRYAIRAVVMSGNEPETMATLGRCYFKRGLYRKAIRWMEKAARAAPDVPRYSDQLVAYRKFVAERPFLYRGRHR